MRRMATLKRVFHILRVVVNKENTALEEELLGMALSLMRRGMRLLVKRYHSAEDRSAKPFMRYRSIR